MRVNVKYTKPVDVLLATRALIADGENWLKGDHASMQRMGDGGAGYNIVEATSPDAVCWCLDGAVIRAMVGPHGRVDCEQEILDAASKQPVYTEVCDLLRGAVEATRDRAENVADSRWLSLFDGATHVQFNDHIDTQHTDVLALLDVAISEAAA